MRKLDQYASWLQRDWPASERSRGLDEIFTVITEPHDEHHLDASGIRQHVAPGRTENPGDGGSYEQMLMDFSEGYQTIGNPQRP